MKNFSEVKMKVDKVNIKYFKFHQNIEINIESKNCLIYGENGTGKSSIYEALYANFYQKKRLNKSLNISEIFKNRNFPTEDLEVNISLNNEKSFNRKANTLDEISIENIVYENSQGQGILEQFINPTVYFANEKVLNRLTKENFFIALKDTMVEHFPELKKLVDTYKEFDNVGRLEKQIIESIEKKENKQSKDIQELDKKIRDEFEKKIESANYLFSMQINLYVPTHEINQIIKEKFDEDFQVSFDIIKAKSSNTDILEFQVPIIKIKIDDMSCTGKLYNHFNEAKLKLIGIAIYFAFAKKFEERIPGGLKLLVLDDFLTSLDMANRKLIIQYILDEFKKYQKIILTHNLQFDNLIKKMINRRNEQKEWDYKFLFLTKEEKGIVAHLKSKNETYLESAQIYLSQGEYQISGNFLRKEFEVIAEELKQILELGEVESLNKIIEFIKNNNIEDYYFKPLTLINFIKEKIAHIKSQMSRKEDNQTAQIGICNSQLTEINRKLLDANQREQIESLASIIEKVEFYKDINFNKASHREKEASYRKEVERGIKLIQELNSMLQNIKCSKSQTNEQL